MSQQVNSLCGSDDVNAYSTLRTLRPDLSYETKSDLCSALMSDAYSLPTIPLVFKDPMTGNLMTDPYITGDGTSYDKATLDTHSGIPKPWYPNLALQSAIQAWVQYVGYSNRDRPKESTCPKLAPSKIYRPGVKRNPATVLGGFLKKLARMPMVISEPTSIPLSVDSRTSVQLLRCSKPDTIWTFSTTDQSNTLVVAKFPVGYHLYDASGHDIGAVSEPDLSFGPAVGWKTDIGLHALQNIALGMEKVLVVGLTPQGKGATFEIDPGSIMRAPSSMIGFGLFKINLPAK